MLKSILFSNSCLLLGSKWSEEFVFLFEGLEFTVTDLGSGIDEFNLELVGGERAGLWKEGLSDGDLSLSWSHNVTSDEKEVLVDNTVMWESTDWGNVLDMGIGLSGGVVLDVSNGTSSNSVDLLIDLSSVVVTEVTSSSNSPLNSRWMPSSDTGNLSETSMSLSWKSGNSESLDDTLSSLTSGNGNGINHLVVLEDLTDGDFVLELGDSPVDLLGNITTVDLDLHNVSLLLSKLALLDLSGADDSDDLAVFLDSLDVSVWVLLGLGVLLVLLGVVGESLSLGNVVVLVESSDDVDWKLLSPDGGQSSESSWGLNVSNHTDDLHWWGFNNGDGLADILLEDLLTLSLLEVSDGVSHTSLVAHEGSKVNWLGFVVLWEVSNLTLIVLGSSLWKVTQMTASWMLKLSVRH